MDATIKNIIVKLESLFSKLNYKLFNGELIKPIITVNKDVTKNAYGWCTTYKAWTTEKNNIKTDSNKGFYEINICAEYLNRNIEKVIETMLHEMCHLYNIQNNIKDCSRAGTYHNKKFKECAEEHGLICIKDEKYGWAFTELNEDMKKWVKEQKIKPIQIRRITPNEKKGNKKKSSSRLYVCPICNLKVRATKPAKVMCVDCNEIMIYNE